MKNMKRGENMQSGNSEKKGYIVRFGLSGSFSTEVSKKLS